MQSSPIPVSAVIGPRWRRADVLSVEVGVAQHLFLLYFYVALPSIPGALLRSFLLFYLSARLFFFVLPRHRMGCRSWGWDVVVDFPLFSPLHAPPGSPPYFSPSPPWLSSPQLPASLISPVLHLFLSTLAPLPPSEEQEVALEQSVVPKRKRKTPKANALKYDGGRSGCWYQYLPRRGAK